MISRLMTTVLGLIVLCLALPTIARVAQHLIPYLVALFVMLAIANLRWPNRWRRR